MSSTDVMTRKPDKAWELYMKMETTTESFNLLQLIANDCYRVSCKLTQYDTLMSRVDSLP